MILTGKVRNINGSYYFLINKDSAEEMRIAKGTLLQVEIKKIKPPLIVNPITQDEIEGGKKDVNE